MIFNLEKYKQKKKFNVNSFLDVFKNKDFLTTTQKKLFNNYNAIIEFNEEDIKKARIMSTKKFGELESAEEIKERICSLRNLISKKENSSYLFAIEILTEDNIKKFLKKNTVSAKTKQRIRTVHLLLIRKAVM